MEEDIDGILSAYGQRDKLLRTLLKMLANFLIQLLPKPPYTSQESRRDRERGQGKSGKDDRRRDEKRGRFMKNQHRLKPTAYAYNTVYKESV